MRATTLSQHLDGRFADPDEGPRITLLLVAVLIGSIISGQRADKLWNVDCLGLRQSRLGNGSMLIR